MTDELKGFKGTPGGFLAFDNAGPIMQGYRQSSGVHVDYAQIVCGCFNDIGGEDVASANARLFATSYKLALLAQNVVDVAQDIDWAADNAQHRVSILADQARALLSQVTGEQS